MSNNDKLFNDTKQDNKREYKLFASNDIARYGLFYFNQDKNRDEVLNPLVCKSLLYLIWKALRESKPAGYMTYPVDMSVKEFGEALGFSKSSKGHNFAKNVKYVIDLVTPMVNRFFVIYDSADIHDYLWIQPLLHLDVDYKHDKIHAVLSEDIGEYFGNAYKNFTVIKLKYLNRLKKTGSVILYPYFCRYLNMGEVHCKASELKKLLTGRDDGVQFKYIKRDYLDPAIREINEKTDIEISYCEEKNSKSVDRLLFYIDKSPALDEIENYLYYNNMRPKEYIPEEYNDTWMEDYMYFMSSQKYVCINPKQNINIAPIIQSIPDDSIDDDDDDDLPYVDENISES